jgi:hypothetical protein
LLALRLFALRLICRATRNRARRYEGASPSRSISAPRSSGPPVRLNSRTALALLV